MEVINNFLAANIGHSHYLVYGFDTTVKPVRMRDAEERGPNKPLEPADPGPLKRGPIKMENPVPAPEPDVPSPEPAAPPDPDSEPEDGIDKLKLKPIWPGPGTFPLDSDPHPAGPNSPDPETPPTPNPDGEPTPNPDGGPTPDGPPEDALRRIPRYGSLCPRDPKKRYGLLFKKTATGEAVPVFKSVHSGFGRVKGMAALDTDDDGVFDRRI